MNNALQTIYRLKTIMVAVIIVILGLGLLFLGRWINGQADWAWLEALPLSELGSTLFVTGGLVVTWDYLDARDRENRDDERVRRLLKEAAPQFRDAVVQGFAVDSADLQRVATPELLDGIAKNVLSLRLGDEQFATEAYAELRNQAIRAPERWHDVEVGIRISTASSDVAPLPDYPLFDVIVSWEYTTVPSHPVQRFACVSDRDEFYELTTDVPATSSWYMTPRPGLDAGSKDCYELLYFAVDGQKHAIRRSARKGGQTYSAVIGEERVRAQKPVRIKHVYRLRTAQSGHRIFVEVPQPTRHFSLELDYTDTDISHLSVTELVSSTQRSRISRLPGHTRARVLSLDLPGWLLPKAGFAFVWTLASEEVAASTAAIVAAKGAPAPH